MQAWGNFDIYCLVCAGPLGIPPIDHDILAASGKLYDDVTWLSSYVGIQEDNVPLNLHGYNGRGSLSFPPGRARCFFHAALSCRLNNIPQRDQHGLTCHKACYQFLHEKLDYKLQFQDIWQLLMQQPAPPPSVLDNDYGGMSEYHDQMRRKPIVLGVCQPLQLN